VLKNRETGRELFVVVISLVPSGEGVEKPEEKVKKTHGTDGVAKKEEHVGGKDDELD